MIPGHYSAHCQREMRQEAESARQLGHDVDAALIAALAETIRMAPKFALDVKAMLEQMKTAGFTGLESLNLPYDTLVIETPVWCDPNIVQTPCDKTIAVVQQGIGVHAGSVLVASCNHVRIPNGTWRWSTGASCAFITPVPGELLMGTASVEKTLRDVSVKVAPFTGQMFARKLKECPLDEQGQVAALYQDIMIEIQAVVALLWSLDRRQATVERYPAPAALNKKRRAKGACEFDEYHVVTLQDSREHSRTGVRYEDRMSPREHQRRGHWRQYQSGARVWVRQAIINEGVGGAIWKDYRVSK